MGIQLYLLYMTVVSCYYVYAIFYRQEMEPEVQKRVSFEKLDATKATFEAESFDMLYSRDAIMHIVDKELLYTNVFVSCSRGSKWPPFALK